MSETINATEAWEAKLCEIHAKIREQEAGATKVLMFLNGYRKDLLEPYDFLKAEMLAAGLPPISERIFDFFPFKKADYESSEDPLEVVRLLQKKLEENPEITEKHWLDFISEAEAVRSKSPKTDGVEAIGWLLGPRATLFQAGTNFLSPTKEHTSWDFRSKAPPAKYLAAWLVAEYDRKKQTENFDVDQWLGTKRTPALIDNAVDRDQVEQIFGSAGPDSLFDLLPPSLQKAVGQIYIVDDIEGEELEDVSDEESSTLLEMEDGGVTVLDLDGTAIMKKEDGFFIRDSRTMVLTINSSTDANDVVNLWFHELGHAMISGMSLADQAIRQRFLKAVATAGLPKGKKAEYVRNLYVRNGIAAGLEDDFAETMRNYVMNFRDFEKVESERTRAIKEILAKFFPDFDSRLVRQGASAFLRKANSRACQVLEKQV
jgi:hypothetical protein